MKATQDEPGPNHAPELSRLGIDGVLTQSFPTVGYPHGGLTELHNVNWVDMFEAPIEHLYVVVNDSGKREEWYEHRATTDRYVLMDGSISVALFDARTESATFGAFELVELRAVHAGGPSGLVIPAGVWHSFRIDSDRVILMNAKTPGYNRDSPDKFRMAMPNDLCSFAWPE